MHKLSRDANTRRVVALTAAGQVVVLAVLAGCQSDATEQSTEQLRQVVRQASAIQLKEAATAADAAPIQRESRVEGLRLSDERIGELEATSGPLAYRTDAVLAGNDLLNRPAESVSIGLQKVVQGAVVGNLGVQAARIVPSVSSAQLVQADAAFDWVLTGSATVNDTDTPQAVPVFGGTPVGANVSDALIQQYSVGLQKNLITGGTLTADWSLLRTDQNIPGANFFPDPGTASTVTLGLNQPLLRGAGSGVARAEIRIARNAERRSISELRSTVQQAVESAETGYWTLFQAQETLKIQQRLLDRGRETSDKIRQRGRLDATAAQIADAMANVEERRANVIEAQDALLRASDSLKAIVNDPDLPVGGEAVLLPLDIPAKQAIEVSLFDAVATALEKRPEIRQALLNIDDASIRQFVGDNQRLPQLDLTFQASALALDNDLAETAFEPIGGEFFEYLVGLEFLRPIGNRAAEANYRASVLARMQTVIDYQNTAQQIVLDVKNALREVQTRYRLIEQRRAARLAAAENLRALTVQIELTEGFTAGNLDLLLRRQEDLAFAERNELTAIIGYNTAIAALQAATGQNLVANNIRFDAPPPAAADNEGR
ncbi:MAG: TolC family protein [Planctomycetota bacterium]